MNRVLVTGGGGFIGSNLVRTLLSAGVEVVVLDDFSTGFQSNLVGLDAVVHNGSICDPDLVMSAMEGCDTVVHLAALGSVPRSVANPRATHEVNVNGTLNVLEAAREHRSKILFSSSSSVYGSNAQLPKVEMMTAMPVSPYAVSKLAGEQYIVAYGLCYGLEVLPFRFFNVFGPGQRANHQYAAVIPRFVDAALKGEQPVVYGDGTQSRDFTYVGDVAGLITRAIVDGISFRYPVNLAFGGRYSLLQVLEVLSAEMGVSLEPKFEQPRKGEVMHSQADTHRLRTVFGRIEPTPFVDGLRATINWFKSSPQEG